MKSPLQLFTADHNQLLAADVLQAHTLLLRMRGLLFETELSWPEHRALWIDPCSSIHTFFMNFPIDVLFVDQNLCVTRRLDDLKPSRLTAPSFKHRSVFEFRAGTLRRFPTVEVGTRLRLTAKESEAK